MTEYTTHAQLDIRELDNLYLATIGGVDYYEERWIVKQQDGRRCCVGRASDWPLIEVRAHNAELTALLTASERHSVEAECHVAELLTRLSGYQEHIAALEVALAETQSPAITAPEAETAEQAFVQAAAPIDAPTPALADEILSPDTRRKCPYCNERPKLSGMQAHMERRHPDQVQVAVVAVPTPPSIALSLGEAPWRCAQCQTATHARSIEQPAFCIRCVVAATDTHTTNGHQVAA